MLSWALAKEKITAEHALENEAYFRAPVKPDLPRAGHLAPVAAHLSRGVPISKLGPALRDFVRLDWPEPRKRLGGIQGEVVYIDRFGNAITNLESGLLRRRQEAACEAHGKPRYSCPVRGFYQAVAPGKPVAVAGSSGFLEIAVNGGSAAKQMGLHIGTPVVLRETR